MTGRSVKAEDSLGWLVDISGPMERAVQKAWALVAEGDHGLPVRTLERGMLAEIPTDVRDLPAADSPTTEAARRAIMACIQDAGGSSLSDALAVQAKHAADFLASPTSREGLIGAEYARIMSV